MTDSLWCQCCPVSCTMRSIKIFWWSFKGWWRFYFPWPSTMKWSKKRKNLGNWLTQHTPCWIWTVMLQMSTLTSMRLKIWKTHLGGLPCLDQFSNIFFKSKCTKLKTSKVYNCIILTINILSTKITTTLHLDRACYVQFSRKFVVLSTVHKRTFVHLLSNSFVLDENIVW